jgi:sulfate permease, SulP family
VDYSATLNAIRRAYALAAIEARSAGTTADFEPLGAATKLAYYLV